MMEEDDEYGDIADEDLIEAFSQESQSLPSLPRNAVIHNNRRNSRSTGSGVSGDEEEDEGPRAKKIRSRMVYGGKEVPAAKIVAATQAEELEALPDSSPYRIRGPIYKKPRPPNEPVPGSALAQKQSPAPIHISTTQSFNTSFGDEFENIPPEFLDDDEFAMFESSAFSAETYTQQARPRQKLVAVQQGLKQTTLFGDRASDIVTPSQAKKVHNYIVDKPPEPPTHHKLNQENLRTWVYPLNLGKIRDYQYSIVRHALFHNTLVALPTGLGKTCIAATIMLNFFRWTVDSQIIFVAPTKPLVAQQVDACFNIVGIPKSQTTLLTGEQPPALRADEWETKRVFFMTPQTLDNDLRTGIADPKKIVLLVVDEAHRATGNYAYVKVVELLRRFNKSFRVLALTATPGANVEAVQDVIDNLEISKVEIRTEESIDIQQYVHRRNIEQILLDPSDEMIMCKDLLAKALQPLVNQLCAQNAYYNKDPMSLTAFGMMQARKSWFASPAGRAASMPIKGMMNALFAVLASIAHSIKLLNFHGIKPFFEKIKDFRTDSEASRNGGGKYRKQILENADFKKMVDRIQMWTSRDDFVGHPKLTYLCDTVLNHFMDAGEGRHGEDVPPSSTRVIVFAEFRDSAETITKALNRHGPMVRASVFVGQANSKRSEGMKQSQQIETIEKFKRGKINVLVATSIGEEGLDIGQVDLIVCYDASGSPIRMLQRMGRTGRKRAGNIVLLLMRGKEEDSFAKAKDNYEKMQKLISSGTSFAMRYDLSVRILPRDIVPEVDKRIIDIPLENTQDPSLPEPKKRQTSKKRKRPEKKFHMPDGVQTGFQKASDLATSNKTLDDMGIAPTKKKSSVIVDAMLTALVPIESVLLDKAEQDTLQKLYLNISGTEIEEVSLPDVTIFPAEQRALGPVVIVQHGQYTKRCVQLFGKLSSMEQVDLRNIYPLTENELRGLAKSTIQACEDEVEVIKVAKKKRVKPVAKTTRMRSPMGGSDVSSSEIDQDTPKAVPAKKPAKGLSKKHKQARLRDSEGEGDDLANSEAASEDSDSGESLQDFVVSTNMATSSVVRSSTSPPPTKSSPLRHPLMDRQRLSAREHPSDDDDTPSVFSRPASSRQVIELDIDTEDDIDDDDDTIARSRAPAQRLSKRRVVDESEDSRSD